VGSPPDPVENRDSSDHGILLLTLLRGLKPGEFPSEFVRTKKSRAPQENDRACEKTVTNMRANTTRSAKGRWTVAAQNARRTSRTTYSDNAAIGRLRVMIGLGDSPYLAHFYVAKAFLRRKDLGATETELKKLIQLCGSGSGEAR